MTDDEIKAMRDDHVLICNFNEQRGIWTKAESIEIGYAIKAAIDKRDEEMLQSWRFALSTDAEFIRQLIAMTAERCRRLEASIHSGAMKAAA